MAASGYDMEHLSSVDEHRAADPVSAHNTSSRPEGSYRNAQPAQRPGSEARNSNTQTTHRYDTIASESRPQQTPPSQSISTLLSPTATSSYRRMPAVQSVEENQDTSSHLRQTDSTACRYAQPLYQALPDPEQEREPTDRELMDDVEKFMEPYMRQAYNVSRSHEEDVQSGPGPQSHAAATSSQDIGASSQAVSSNLPISNLTGYNSIIASDAATGIPQQDVQPRQWTQPAYLQERQQGMNEMWAPSQHASRQSQSMQYGAPPVIDTLNVTFGPLTSSHHAGLPHLQAPFSVSALPTTIDPRALHNPEHVTALSAPMTPFLITGFDGMPMGGSFGQLTFPNPLGNSALKPHAFAGQPLPYPVLHETDLHSSSSVWPAPYSGSAAFEQGHRTSIASYLLPYAHTQTMYDRVRDDDRLLGLGDLAQMDDEDAAGNVRQEHNASNEDRVARAHRRRSAESSESDEDSAAASDVETEQAARSSKRRTYNVDTDKDEPSDSDEHASHRSSKNERKVKLRRKPKFSSQSQQAGTKSRKSRSSTGKAKANREHGYNRNLEEAPHVACALPQVVIGAYELLCYFPNHTQWPAAITRLICNEWTTDNIGAAQLFARGNRNGDDHHRRAATLRYQVLSGGRQYFGLQNFTRWRYPSLIHHRDMGDASTWTPRVTIASQLRQTSLVRLAQGVINPPQGQDRGVVHQAIELAIQQSREHWLVRDIPRIVVSHGLQMPVDAANCARWDISAKRRFHTRLEAAGGITART